MAIRFHPLPVEVFGDTAQPFIQRLNYELRDLFGFEATLTDQMSVRRSDQSIAKNNTVIDSSRISNFTTVVNEVVRESSLGSVHSRLLEEHLTLEANEYIIAPTVFEVAEDIGLEIGANAELMVL